MALEMGSIRLHGVRETPEDEPRTVGERDQLVSTFKSESEGQG
jgi:hypothetical protein